MIKIDTLNVYGFKEALYGLRQSYNSHEKSDSEGDTLGENDLALMYRLANKGGSHAKFRRMINVYADINAPLYWWKQFDTYKIGTVTCSTSTMHNIHDKPFTIDDFSCDHLGYYDCEDENASVYYKDTGITGVETAYPMDYLIDTINILEHNRKKFLETGDSLYWWQIIQLLPSSYNQLRTVMLNYETLSRIYEDRKNHRLGEWRNFCDWSTGLPYGKELITALGLNVHTSIESYKSVPFKQSRFDFIPYRLSESELDDEKRRILGISEVRASIGPYTPIPDEPSMAPSMFELTKEDEQDEQE